MNAGHSDAPLAKKLNLRDEQRVWFEDMPANIQDEIDEYALELIFVGSPAEGFDAGHIFVVDAETLTDKLTRLRPFLSSDGQIWVSWPKQGSDQQLALDQTDVLRIGMAAGFVDTKDCTVDEIWSGIKFVIPKAER